MQDYVSFEITSNIGGTQRTGVFEVSAAREGAFSFEHTGRTGYLAENGVSNIVALFNRAFDSGDGFKKGIHVALGAGEHAMELECNTPGTTKLPDGSVPQWGSSASTSDGPNRHTATGASKEAQMAVLMEYWRTSTTDSLATAKLEAYEYSSSGIMEPLTVAMEQPTVRIDNQNPQRGDISITFVETQDLEQTIDAYSRTLG